MSVPEDVIQGEGWLARCTAEGCTLSWDGGDLAFREVEVAISAREFEKLRRDPASFRHIALKHDPNQPSRRRR